MAKKIKTERIQWKNQLINFVAIIIGVYVAFYITERSARASKQKQVQYMLSSMADDLEEDIKNLKGSTDTLKFFLKVSKSLANSVAIGHPPKDSINFMINSLSIMLPFVPKDNSFQSLQMSGNFELVDMKLRKEITELYHQHYGAIRISDNISEQMRIEMIAPFLMQHLQFDANGLKNANELWKNTMFVNLAFSTQYSLRLKYQLDSTAYLHATELRNLLLNEM